MPKKPPSQVLPSWPSPPVLRAWEAPDLPPGHVFSDGTSLSRLLMMFYSPIQPVLYRKRGKRVHVPHIPRDNKAEGSEARTGDAWVTPQPGRALGPVVPGTASSGIGLSQDSWRAGSVPTSGAVPAGVHSLLNRGLSPTSHRTCPPLSPTGQSQHWGRHCPPSTQPLPRLTPFSLPVHSRGADQLSPLLRALLAASVQRSSRGQQAVQPEVRAGGSSPLQVMRPYRWHEGSAHPSS